MFCKTIFHIMTMVLICGHNFTVFSILYVKNSGNLPFLSIIHYNDDGKILIIE
jgi:hypothetical protein